jgi:hypothetical protein
MCRLGIVSTRIDIPEESGFGCEAPMFAHKRDTGLLPVGCRLRKEWAIYDQSGRGKARRPVHDPQPHARREAAPGGRLVSEQIMRFGRSEKWCDAVVQVF